MIRSLTIGLPLDDMATSELDSSIRKLLAAAEPLLSAESLTPRTMRYTLPPTGADGEAEGMLHSRLRWVDEFSRSTGFRWFCAPLDLVSSAHRRGRIASALDSVGRFDRMFLNLIVASKGHIAVNSLQDVAKLVLDISRKSNNGFDNFRVGVSFNCPPNAPFFPFSMHEGPHIAFSFALETTQLALDAINGHGAIRDVSAARDLIVSSLSPLLVKVDSIGVQLAESTGALYKGLDASFAPLPHDKVSVGALVEQLIGTSVGSHASVFATSLLTDALRSAIDNTGVRSVGFNGVMYSVLEDHVLASANNQRRISIDSLLALSTVCACGLDMVPVPGISFPEEIAAVMLDVAAISSVLDKPLGVRLLPIPKGNTNDFTQLNLDFLCDSRVIGLTANDRRITTQEHLLRFLSPRIRLVSKRDCDD
jgi:uncharacterized protein